MLNNAISPLAWFKALADETRLRLLRILARHELSVGEIVAVLGMGQSRVSRHLAILVGCGLLSSRREGAWTFYSLAAAAPEADLAAVDEVLRERRRETRRFFNTIAPDWASLRREVLGELDPAELVRAVMPAAVGLAADLGCGPGDLLPVLAERARRVIGVDSSPSRLSLAERRTAGLPVGARMGELEHLPMADGEADFLVICLTLHHLPDPAAALAEARRVLAPEGRLVVIDFAPHGDEVMRRRFGDRWLGFSREKLSEWLDRAGFALADWSEHPVNRGLVAARAVAIPRQPSPRSAQ
ncbi:metalloregulator ArsR/SmtB family transcription factor [Solidesulfovibrio sp.]|uniref:ArsR/SmtB family transcription factor n=1 Tax=Solidesulfovibrio sp. TaxID=2910990 RepID=UPI002B208E04|nr:metalloregulator ArsR/SmtB family transcription factor [Solidesulfovibrio sp.]MEA4855872.1 metalloregulator ArsR/SmtB family transcription factor [Solidesulfovibrio sp.]